MIDADDEATENVQEKVNPKYTKGYSGKALAARKREIEKRAKEPHEDPRSYRPFKTDIDKKTGKPHETKPSKFTQKFKKMFGEAPEGEQMEDDAINELRDFLRMTIADVLSEAKSNVTKSLKNKAKKANAPMAALRAIYNKGLAAWRTGHRKGASPHAWAMARVNSVLTGGPARKVDAAQWKQIQKFRGKKRKK